MKICILNISSMNSDTLRNAMIDSCKKVANPDTEIVYKDTKKGVVRTHYIGYGYTRLLNAQQIIEAALEAQHEGCDAVINNCTLDAGISEAQGVLDIPIIRVTDACLKYATLLGQKFGIATLYEHRWVSHYRRLIKTYGLDDFCIDKDPVRSVDITTDDVIKKGMKDPQLIVNAVRKTAEDLANDGAEVVQIGCGLFDSICAMAGLNSVMDGKVPLVAPLLVGLKMAEIMVTFKQELGTPFQSGLSCYEKIPKEDLNSIRVKYDLPTVE